jgi:glycosyltransferase involved in cell wall biosynthesis
MRKILFLIKGEGIGGLEKVLFEIVERLDCSKYQITVMTGDYNKEVERNLPHYVKYKNLFPKKFKGLDSILVYLPPKLLHKIFIKENYDLEVSFQEGYPTKIISGASEKLKKICWLHNDPFYYDFNLPFFKSKDKLRANLEKFDEIIAVSNFILEEYQKYINLDRQIKVVYNPVDKNNILALSKEEIPDLKNNGKFRICYVGRLSEEKQVEMLVDSVILLQNIYKNVELIIVGDGHKYSEIFDKINNANAQNYIKLLGYKENPYPYIRNSSLVVCCSKTESFCLVVAESIVLGVPVLSTKCGGPQEILENGKYGVLVENNFESLYQGIERMVLNREFYLKYKNVIKDPINKYDKGTFNFLINKILEERSHGKDSIS